MNLELDGHQRDLVAVTTDLCASLADSWRTPSGAGHPSLKSLSDVGVLGVRHPEPEGIGLGPVEAVLVAQVCGAALAPTPLLIWADLVGPAVPGVLAGEISVTGALAPLCGFSFGGLTRLTVAVDARGAHIFDSGAIEWEPLAQVDPAIPRALARGLIPTDSELIADVGAVEQWRWQMCLLGAAHLVGVGRAAVDTSAAYAKERYQFGRPIGSFQAIKHLLADAYTAVEMAASQVLVAAQCWAEQNPVAPEQARVAAVVAARASLTAAETAIQVHGGLGFTAEMTPHLYYKRALLIGDELRAAGGTARSLLHRDLTLDGS